MPLRPDIDGSDGDCLFEPLDTHFSHLTNAKVLIDLRRYPRFETHFSAEAISEDGRKTVVTISNISRTGLRLEGNQQMLDALFPGFSGQTKYSPTTLRVHFTVPRCPNRHGVVKVQCKSVYIRQENQDTWQIGMKFVGIDEGDEALTEYLVLRENTG